MRHPATTVPRRNIPLLSALAIIGVVLNHAVWQVLSNIPAGSRNGYTYLPLDQMGKIAIPAFMFIAGYFIAYATSGGRKPLAWNVVRARIGKLFWPWVLWAFIWLGMQVSAQVLGLRSGGTPLGFNIRSILLALFAQYYFIPMLMVYYLAAPLLVRIARRSLRALFFITILLQLAGVALFYIQVYAPHTLPPGLQSGNWLDVTLLQYLRFAFYFPLGLASGMKPSAFAPLLRWRKALPWLTALAFVLATLEGGLAYGFLRDNWQRGDSHVKVTSMLLSLGLIFCFMVYSNIPVPAHWRKPVRELSANTYGLYLAHYVVMAVLDKIIARFVPPSVPLQILYIFLLVAATLSLSLWMIHLSMRSGRLHDLLFG